ncbi:MAG: hypothetical protein OXC39_01010 [Candidatus Dadabacteria bacterium]|nr:hypothetical protein [Candidatus Dadabacteria bacterium]
MDTKPQAREFYLDSIDEVFAEVFFLFGTGFDVRMEIVSETSLVSASFSPRIAAVDREGAVDFELCAFECSGVSAENLEEYLGIPVHTSSALEFFDYVFSQKSEVVCSVGFGGNSWLITVDD